MEGLLLTGLFVLLALFLAHYRRQKRYPLPPGPKGYPIIGNALDIPARWEWLQYEKWSRDYGMMS